VDSSLLIRNVLATVLAGHTEYVFSHDCVEKLKDSPTALGIGESFNASGFIRMTALGVDALLDASIGVGWPDLLEELLIAFTILLVRLSALVLDTTHMA
jgi:hypothetical protein